MRAEVNLKGPVFDGSAARIMRAVNDEVEDDIATEGVNVVRSELGHLLDNPTGYYESRIQTDRARGGTVVNDGGVIYGPWLEGTSSRNKSTRFKGYRAFRLAGQRLNQQAPEIAARTVQRHIGRLQ